MRTAGVNAVTNQTVAEGQNFGPNWLVLTLPYIEQGNLYDGVATSVNSYLLTGDSGWRSVRGTRVKGFLCPSNAAATEQPWPGVTNFPGWARGNYACNAAGIHQFSTTGWTGSAGGASPKQEANPPFPIPDIPVGTPAGGVMCLNWGVAIPRIPDGSSNTVMLAEVRSGGDLASTDARGVWALGFPGASVVAGQFSWDCLTPNNTDSLADDVGPGSVDAYQRGMGACTGCPFTQAQSRSKHTGGVMVVMADGSTRFVRDSISVANWFRMNSRDDGMTASE